MKSKSFFFRLWENIKYKKKLLFLILLTSLLTQGFFVLLPVLIQNIIDNNINNVTEKCWYESKEGIKVSNFILTQDIEKINSNPTNEYGIFKYEEKYYLIKNFNPKKSTIIYIDGNKAIERNGNNISSENIFILKNQDIQDIYKYQQDSLNKRIFFYGLLVLFLPFLAFLNATLVRKFSREVSADFRIKGVRKLFKVPMHFYSTESRGKIISYIIQDISMFYNLTLNILIQFLQSFIMFMGVYVILFFINYKIFLIALLLLPIILIWIVLYKNKMSKYYNISRTYFGKISSLLGEQFTGQRIIKSFNNQKFAYKEFNELNKEYFNNSLLPIKYNSLIAGSMVNVIRRTLWIFILIYASFSYFGRIDVGITAGSIFLLISLVNNFMDPMYQILGIITALEQASVSINRYFDFIDLEEEKKEIGLEKYKNYKFKGKIQFKNLSFSYDNSNTVLNNINLNVPAFKKIGIVGKTGSGKSSLMNLLLRFYDNYSGEILIDDINIKNIRKEDYRKNISVILQSPKLFKGTLKENITWNNKEITDEYVIKVIKQLEAYNLLNKKRGIHYNLTEGGNNLSIGEKQQISFARAIMNNPNLLILDEATANIDTYTERLLQKALEYASTNRTTFIIAHRLSTIKNLDLIIVLDHGVIIEQGTHNELLALKGKYYNMYNAQINQDSSIFDE